MGIRVPEFEYDGGSAVSRSGNKYWYIICKTSNEESGATIKFKYDKTVDIFLVGGGGAGGSGNGASGGGGGEVLTVKGVKLSKDVKYGIRIGAGGEGGIWQDGENGEKTTFRLSSSQTYTANGGKGGQVLTGSVYDVGAPGGAGGSGGGAGTYQKGESGGSGGYNGNDGGSTSEAQGGDGKGNGTRGFGQNIGDDEGVEGIYVLFAGGGGGSARNKEGGQAGVGGAGGGGMGGGEKDGVTNVAGADGTANTGGGGGGSSGAADETPAGGNGGSGIVIIRSTMPDYLPVYFNGTRLTDIYYQIGNGGTKHKLDTLTFNGTELY